MLRWLKVRRAERRELAALRGEMHERYLVMKEREIEIELKKVENRRFELEIRAHKELGQTFDWSLPEGEADGS